MTLSCCRVAALFVLATGVAANPYHDAVGSDDTNLLKRLISSKAPGLDETGPGGQSPLMMAVLMGKDEAVKHLLAAGADTKVGEQDGYTPLHGAGFQGRAEIARMLVAHGLDPNEMHRDGYTPIHRACWGAEERHTDTVRVLLESGVSPSQPTARKQLPVQLTQNAATRKLLHEYLHADEPLPGGGERLIRKEEV